MATYVDLTVPAKDIIGALYDPKRTSVYIEANTPNSLIIVDAVSIRIGGRRENIGADGTFTFEGLPGTNSVDNPASGLQYRITIVYTPKGAKAQEHITTGWFPLTADANLAAVEEAWDDVTAPPSWRSDFRDEMEALIAGVEDSVADAVEAYLVANPPAGGGSGNVTLVDNGDGTWTMTYGDIDTTGPIGGTLAASAVTATGFTLTITGASDAVELHASPYAFSLDNGDTWSAWQAGTTYAATGLVAGTPYTVRHKVRDAQGNETIAASIDQETAAGIAFDVFVMGSALASGASATVNLSTATVGSLALVLLARQNIGAPSAVPAGWTLEASYVPATIHSERLYSKVLGPGDLTTHTWTLDGSRHLIMAATYLGVTDADATAAGATTGTYTTFPFGTKTTTEEWVAAIGVGYATTARTFGAITGYTNRSGGTVGNDLADMWAVWADTNGTHPGGATTPTSAVTTGLDRPGAFLVALS